MIEKPQLTILRGLPGVGKSSYVSRIAREWNGGNGGLRVFSADHFFTDQKTGKYVYDKEKQGEAHDWCLRTFTEFVLPIGKLLTSSTPVRPSLLIPSPENPAPRLHLIVDNTNLRAAEIAPYYALGKAYGFDAQVVTIRFALDKAFARQVHGVSRETFEKMARVLTDEDLPPWWKHVELNMVADPAHGEDQPFTAVMSGLSPAAAAAAQADPDGNPL